MIFSELFGSVLPVINKIKKNLILSLNGSNMKLKISMEVFYMKKILYLSTFIFIFIFQAYAGNVLKIVGSEWPPYQIIDESTQKLSGYATEVLQSALTKAGVEFDIKYFKWSIAVESAKKGNFDLLYSASYKKDRAESFIYPKEPLHFSEYVFFIRKADAAKIKYTNSFAELDKFKIGIVKEYAYSDEFLNYCKGRADVVTVASDILGFGLLHSKQIDILPCEKLNGFALLKNSDKFKANDFTIIDNPFIKKEYFFLASKNSTYPKLSELIEKLDSIIADMKKSGEMKKIEDKYIK